MERRTSHLKEYAESLLQGIFAELVCSKPVLYLNVFIEEAYESCVGPNQSNLDSFTMMKSIESLYENLSMELDNLPTEVVAKCEYLGFQQQIKIMKKAEDATRKVNIPFEQSTKNFLTNVFIDFSSN